MPSVATATRFCSGLPELPVPSRVVSPTGVRPRPFGFSPKESITENDFALTLGAKGDLGGWLYDVATTYGKDDNDVNVSQLPERLALFRHRRFADWFPRWDFIGTQWTTNFDISHAFEVGLAGPLTFAAGLGYRKDR